MQITVGTLCRAVIVRLFFFIHAVLSVWRVVVERDNSYWWLLLIPCCLFVECIVTLRYTKAGEWQSFRPCIFIYLTSVVICIWIIEYDIVDERTSAVKIIENKSVSVCSAQADEGMSAGQLLLNVSISDNVMIVFPEFDSDTWSLAVQQTLLFFLIVGGWALPRGGLTHKKLSNALLIQIGMAADILEFLDEGVRTDEVLCLPSVIIGALVLWTWSLLQLPFNWDTKAVRRLSLSVGQSTGKKGIFKRCSDSEVWEITSAIIMQDGPFLCMRFFFLFYLGVFNQALVFFIAKNILVLLLLFYRLWALLCLEVDDEGKKSFIFSRKIRSLRDNLTRGNTEGNHDPESGGSDEQKDDNQFRVTEKASAEQAPPATNGIERHDEESDEQKDDNQFRVTEKASPEQTPPATNGIERHDEESDEQKDDNQFRVTEKASAEQAPPATDGNEVHDNPTFTKESLDE